MKKTKKRIRSLTATTVYISLCTLVLWVVSMFCVTGVAAQYFYDIILDSAKEYSAEVYDFGLLSDVFEDEDRLQRPGFRDYRIMQALLHTRTSAYPNTAEEGFHILRSERIPLQTAVTFRDSRGNLLHQSGNYLYFSYDSEDIWAAEQEEDSESGYAWIDLGDDIDYIDPFSALRKDRDEQNSKEPNSAYVIRVLRITGYMEGTQMIPCKIEYVTDGAVSKALEQIEPDYFIDHGNGHTQVGYTFTYSGLDHGGLLAWETAFEGTPPSDCEIVTLYTDYHQFSFYDPGSTVIYEGNSYPNLMTLLCEKGANLETELGAYSLNGCEHSLWRITHFDSLQLYDTTSTSNSTAPEITMHTAVTASPMLAAASSLYGVYIATFLLSVALVLALRGMFKQNVIRPLKQVNNSIADDWQYIYPDPSDMPAWQELYELRTHYDRAWETLHWQKNELTRLNTALEYAKDAEENRRKMTSNIAHELKTPLAVIHGYAEGLKERIAEDKRDKYVDVILSETEHLDDMVLELLDLSRLEAGKVKLAQDNFSLADLVNGVFERLEMAVTAKDLTVEFDFPDESTVTADEGRIRQAVENFATNAVKYTPIGGKIRVGIQRSHFRSESRTSTTFSIENESPPLPDDALSKVWETFYRADNARSNGGTGLGLAITKNIIELHGGKCSVRNTPTGVEFQFTL